MPCADRAQQCQKTGCRRAPAVRRAGGVRTARGRCGSRRRGRLDAPRPRGVVLDLAAQVPDVDVDDTARRRRSRRRAARWAILARDWMSPRLLGEREREGRTRSASRRARAPSTRTSRRPVSISSRPPSKTRRSRCGASLPAARRRSALTRAMSSSGLNGFGHVVVGAEARGPRTRSSIRPARAQDEDRHPRAAAHLAEAPSRRTCPGSPRSRTMSAGAARARAGRPARRAVADSHRVAVALEACARATVLDDGVVVDDQDALVHGGRTPSSGNGSAQAGAGHRARHDPRAGQARSPPFGAGSALRVHRAELRRRRDQAARAMTGTPPPTWARGSGGRARRLSLSTNSLLFVPARP